MTDFLPWLIIAVLAFFGFIYGPLRQRTKRTASQRRHVVMAVVVAAALPIVVGILCVLAAR
jgi:hypothetical protein